MFYWARYHILCQYETSYRVLHTLDVAADNGLTGNFRSARPHWNKMARLSCNAKFPNPLQMYGWVIWFEINCTWKQMSHGVMSMSMLAENFVDWWKLARNSRFICGMQQTKSFKLYMFTRKRQAWDLSWQATLISSIIYQHFQLRNLTWSCY